MQISQYEGIDLYKWRNPLQLAMTLRPQCTDDRAVLTRPHPFFKPYFFDLKGLKMIRPFF